MPEDIPNRKQFFEKSFINCGKILEQEIAIIRPKLIICLSERVLHILSEKYMGIKLNMKDSYGKLFELKINGIDYYFIPVVHLPKGANSNVAKTYFPYQTERLKNISFLQFI